MLICLLFLNLTLLEFVQLPSLSVFDESFHQVSFNVSLLLASSSYFLPFQFGIGAKNGVESIAWAIRLSLSSPKDGFVLYQNDAKNAFNCASRSVIRETLSSDFPELLPFFDLCYGTEGLLRVCRSDRNNTFTWIRSREGTQQGDPLGPFFFCIALLPILKEIHVRFPHIIDPALMDDVALLGPFDEVIRASRFLISALETINLKTNMSKCLLFIPSTSSSTSSFPPSSSSSSSSSSSPASSSPASATSTSPSSTSASSYSVSSLSSSSSSSQSSPSHSSSLCSSSVSSSSSLSSSSVLLLSQINSLLDQLSLSPKIIKEDGVEIRGVRQLGIPVGSSSFVQNFIQEKTNKIIFLMKDIQDMINWEEEQETIDKKSKTFKNRPAKQISLFLLRYLFSSRFSFLSRLCTPSEMQSACQQLEQTFRFIFQSSFHLFPLSEEQWQQVFLPIRFGGLGFIPPSLISFSAFTASINTFLNSNFFSIFNSSFFDLPAFLSSNSPLSQQVSLAQATVDHLLVSFSSNDKSAPSSRVAVKQQHIATFALRQRIKNIDLLLPSPRDQIRLSTLRSKPSSSFLSAIPSSYDLLINSNLMPLVLSSFLDLPFPLSLPRFCLCGFSSPLHKIFSEHLCVCNWRAAQRAHDFLAHSVSELARQAGHSVSGQSSILHYNPDNNTRADIKISEASPALPSTIVDFEIRNTISRSSFDSSSGLPKPVLLTAEKEKTNKHSTSCTQMGCRFVPFIVDRFSALAPQADRLFNSLINEIPPELFVSPNWSASSPLSYWKQRLSVNIWSSLAHEVLILNSRSLHHSGAIDRL